MTAVNGETIRYLRERASLNKRQLAERAFIHISTLRRIENGHQQPTRGVRRSISRALGVSEETLTMELLDDHEDDERELVPV